MYMVEGADQEKRIYLCESSSIFAKLAVAVISLGLVLHLAGLSSAYWVVAQNPDGEAAWHEGVWQSCFKTKTGTWVCSSYEVSHHSKNLPSWFQTVQALSILAVITLVPASFVALLYCLLPKLSGRKVAALLSISLELLSGLCIILSVIVYRAKYPTPDPSLSLSLVYHWSFGVEIVAAILCFSTAGLTFADMRQALLI